MGFEKSTGRGGGPDVILVDTTWNNVDFLAYQLARRGLGVHAFTPRLRRPRYLRVAILTGLTWSSRWAKRVLMLSGPWWSGLTRRCIIPCTEEALYWLWDQPATSSGCVSRMWHRPSGRCCWIGPCCWRRRPPGGCRFRRRCRWAAGRTVIAAIAAGLPLMVKSGQSVGSKGVALCRTPGRSSRHSSGSPRWAHR